jgi:transcriptional regulator with XRE-family HTH domain
MRLPRLKQIRERRALSQDALAELAGIARNTICQIELGHTYPHASTVRRLADALGVELEELMGLAPSSVRRAS